MIPITQDAVDALALSLQIRFKQNALTEIDRIVEGIENKDVHITEEYKQHRLELYSRVKQKLSE